MSIQNNPLQPHKIPQETTPSVTRTRSTSLPELPSQEKTIESKVELFQKKSSLSGPPSENVLDEGLLNKLSSGLESSDPPTIRHRSESLPHPSGLEQVAQVESIKPEPIRVEAVLIEVPSNQSLINQIKDVKKPLDERLNTISRLDLSEDKDLAQTTLQSFIKDNGKEIRQTHASFLACSQQVDTELKKAISNLPQDNSFKQQMGLVQKTETTLNQKMMALNTALRKGEDVAGLLSEIENLRDSLTKQMNGLKLVLPEKNQDLALKDLKRMIQLRNDSLDLKLQSLRLDILAQAPKSLSASGLAFLCKDPLPVAAVKEKSEEILLLHTLGRTPIHSKGDIDKMVQKIAAAKDWKLDTNEKFEAFYRNVLGSEGLRELPHALRGHLMARLHQAGIGNPDLIVHYIMNNARNMTEVPDRKMLQRPEIQATDIYQKARDSVLKQSFNKLKAQGETLQLLHQLKTSTRFDTGVLGTSDQPNIANFSKLKEALTDKHVGASPLINMQERGDFISHLEKTYGLDVSVLKAGDGQKKLNLLLEALVTGDRTELAKKDKDVFVLATLMDSKNARFTVPPLARLYFEIQHSDQKDALVQGLKTGTDLKLDALLGPKGMPEQKAVHALAEALRLNDKDSLKDAPELQLLYQQIQDHPQKAVLIQALRQIPVLEAELHTRMLEMPEATALKAYETVVNAMQEHPDYGRFQSFHTELKDAASQLGYTEGRENVPEFQKFQGRLDPGFFKKLDQIKNLSDPLKQKEAAEQLLTELKFKRAESKIQDFFMDHVLEHIQQDRKIREEVNIQFRELMDLKRPLTQSDLRDIGKICGNNMEYYSEAVALLNPKAPTTLSKLFSDVGLRAGEMGVTRLGPETTAPEFHTSPELTQALSQVKKPATESGKVHEFFSAITSDAQPQNREWAINLALIRHSLAQVPQDDKTTRDQLTQRALSYLTRFASIPNPKDLGVQTTPLQKPLTDYHRANSNPLVKKYRETVASHLGVASENIQLVTDNRVMEVLKRDLRTTGHHQVVDAFDPKLSAEDQGKLLKQLVNHAITGDDKSSFFVDISPILGKNFKGGSQDEAFVKDYIQTSRQFVSDVITSTAEEVALDRYKQAHPEDTRSEKEIRSTVLQSPELAKIKQDLQARVVIGGTLNVGNQAVLYTAPVDTDFDISKPVERKLDTNANSEFKNLVYHSGFTVGPQQMLENWTQLSGLDHILGSLEVPGSQVKFPSTGVKLEAIGPWSDLLNHDTFKAFENLKTEPQPYLQVLPSATASLLKGLNETDIQRVFQAKGLDDLYQMSSNRILSAMEQIVSHKGNFNQVLDQVQLIHEEIATLLAIAQPHQAKDFNATLKKVTDLMPDDFDKSIQPEFFLKNSGMRGLATVFTGVESLKGSGQLNIAVQNDTYYESAFVITGDKDHGTLGNREHKLFSLDGDKVDETASQIKKDLSDKKLDLYLCEFHHNISYSKTSYHMENLTQQVDKLFSEKMVSDHFTVAIDNTIAETNGKEFKDFLKHNEDRIKDGKLNIVFYRSAQKFDMLGMDNYNGGIMSVINNGKDFKAFNGALKESEGRQDQLSDINMQGFSHFEKYAQKELNAYRSGIMKAASNMANPDSGSVLAFPKAMYHAQDDDISRPKALLKIAANTDPSAVFLDLSCPLYEVDSPGAKDFLAQLQANLIRRNREKPEDFPLSNRASFGFPHSNISLIGGSKFRFNPGLESEETLKNFQQHFIKLNELMMEAYAGAPNDSLRGAAVKSVITSTGDKLMKLRDQVNDLEAKVQPVPHDLRLQLVETYLNCRNHSKAQEHIDKLETGGGLSTAEQTQLTKLKAQLRSDQLDIQITALEKASQPVSNALRMELAAAELIMGHTGNVKEQLEKVDYAHLDNNGRIEYKRLKDSVGG